MLIEQQEPPKIRCTACGKAFPDWETWLAHRGENRDMRLHDSHTRYCLMSFEEWLDYAIVESQHVRVLQLV